MAYVMLNDAFLPEDEACISVDDRGFLYGESVFTTIRCYQGTPFCLAEHVKRLNHSLAHPLVDMPCAVDQAQLQEQIKELIRRNGCPSALARLRISRGRGVGPLPPAGIQPTILLTVTPYDPAPDPPHARLMVSALRRDADGHLGQHKLGSYFLNLAARRVALAQGYSDAVLLDTADHVLECTCSNLFLVQKGVLVTPDLSQNLLPGTARAVVHRCAREAGLQIEERQIPVADLDQAEEIFLTNASVEIAPVVTVEARKLSPVPGPVTKALMDRYHQQVLEEIS